VLGTTAIEIYDFEGDSDSVEVREFVLNDMGPTGGNVASCMKSLLRKTIAFSAILRMRFDDTIYY
jgi:hypothetical protein